MPLNRLPALARALLVVLPLVFVTGSTRALDSGAERRVTLQPKSKVTVSGAVRVIVEVWEENDLAVTSNGRDDEVRIEGNSESIRVECTPLATTASVSVHLRVPSDSAVTVRSEDDAYAETFEFNPNTEVVLPGHDRRLTFRFGPVPPEALELNLRFEVSMRSSHQSTHRIPKAGG